MRNCKRLRVLALEESLASLATKETRANKVPLALVALRVQRVLWAREGQQATPDQRANQDQLD